MAQEQEMSGDMQVGDGLYIRVVKADSLKEQEINAQEMSSAQFDRLVENVRERGALESLPYCSQPGGNGPVWIISGHHRVRAAVAAGLPTFPVLIDTKDMPRSLVRAKQIAHNQLVGQPDLDLLRKMVEQIDSPEDLLVSGLNGDELPKLEPDSTKLDLPSAEFDWRIVNLLFLPEQLSRLEELIGLLGKDDLLGVAREDQFTEFSKAMVSYGHAKNIKSMATVIDELTKIALAQIADMAAVENDGEE